MTQDNDIQDDEIDLVELLGTLWDGRWLIIGITSLCVVLGGLFAYIGSRTYTGELEIRPIPSWSAQQYAGLNALDFFNIDRSRLLNLFVEDLSVQDSIAQAIQTYSDDPRRADETTAEYADRLAIAASAYQLLPPTQAEETRNREVRRFWTMKVESQESEETIRVILRDALHVSEQNVRRTLRQSFEQAVQVRRTNLKYNLEDIATTRDNLFEDYEKLIQKRLSYLEEQAEIARALGIKQNTLDAQLFQAGSALVANVSAEAPFYLRGYEAIEKEITLLRNRDNKEAFIADLIATDQQARAIEQNRLLDRAVLAFDNTPVVTGDFKAAAYTVAAIELQSSIKPTLIIVLSALGGGFLAMILVLIRSAIKKRIAQ